jgi:hypothetical protein
MSEPIKTAKGFFIVLADDFELVRGGRGRAQLQPRSPASGKTDDWSEGLSCFQSVETLLAGSHYEVGDDYFVIDVAKLVILNVYWDPDDAIIGHRFIRPESDDDLLLWMESVHSLDKDHPGRRWTTELQGAIVPNENKGQWRTIK